MILTRLNQPLLAKEALFVSVASPPTKRPMLGLESAKQFVTLRTGRRRPALATGGGGAGTAPKGLGGTARHAPQCGET